MKSTLEGAEEGVKVKVRVQGINTVKERERERESAEGNMQNWNFYCDVFVRNSFWVDGSSQFSGIHGLTRTKRML